MFETGAFQYSLYISAIYGISNYAITTAPPYAFFISSFPESSSGFPKDLTIVAVTGRNQTLFHHVFQSRHCVQSTVSLSLR